MFFGFLRTTSPFTILLNALLIFVFIFARTSSEIIDENTPIKSSNVLEKEYEQYEMSNYR